jgi:hypothetical protein
MTTKTATPAALFDAILKAHNLKNDAELSRRMQVPPPVISKVRRARVTLGASLMIRIHETFGLPISEIRSLSGVQSTFFSNKE